MSSPHLRRRYRATGARSGLTYLFVLVAAAAIYIGQHVYTIRQQRAVDALGREVEAMELAVGRLTACRDSLQLLAAVGPRARALGLDLPDLQQFARLPLDAPILYAEPVPAAPATVADAATRIWHWLDPPGVSPNEVRAGE